VRSNAQQHSRLRDRVQVDARWCTTALLGGLAGVFLVNALVAFLQPSDFTALVDHSVLGRWFPMLMGRWLAWVIGINDLLLGTCLVASIRWSRSRPIVLAWAGVWLLAVTLVKMTSLRALGG
jgi:hypothetical protein